MWYRLIPIYVLLLCTAAVSQSITLNFLGDCTLGSEVYNKSFDEMYQKVTPAYFFSGVKGILSKGDLNIANLETSITDSGNPVEKTFRFKGKPEYLQILKEGNVQVVNIANNHTHDYGEIGYRNTLTNLKKYGIAYYGYENVYTTVIKGIKLAFIGYMGRESRDTLFLKIRQYKYDGYTVIVTLHWGIESTYKPIEAQVQLAHFLIVAGADLVVGHHPHVLQPVECYNGKYILYSIGNFCFGGNINPRDKSSAIFQVIISKDQSIRINKIPISISSHTDFNDYRPMLKNKK